jgi:hypothetical protein
MRGVMSDIALQWQFVPLDVDVTGNITAKLCEVWSEFNIFCTLITMVTAAILNFFNPKSCQTIRWTQSFAVMFPVTSTSSGTR